MPIVGICAWDGDSWEPIDNDAFANLAALLFDDDGLLKVAVDGIVTVDAGEVTYTPAVATDWDGDADPGETDDALDQLAERVDDLEAAPGGGADIGARVYHDADQSIANATLTALSLNSERWDTDSIHDTVTNNSRLTCKTAGKYIITATISWEADATGVRDLQIVLNGSDIIANQRNLAVDGGAVTRQVAATLYDLDVNNYVEIIVRQTSGGALDLDSVANCSPEFAMQLIAPT